jgi:hypothetical protein
MKRGKRRLKSAWRSDPKHLEFVRSQPCCVRGCLEPGEPHHVRSASTSGTGLKPADLGHTISVCRKHHDEGHDRGWRTFERKYGLDLAAEAAFLGSVSGQEMP